MEPDVVLKMVFENSELDDVMNQELRAAAADTTSNIIPKDSLQRHAICRFIYLLMKTSPTTCCQIQYLTTLVSLYWGTTSKSDQLLLSALHLFETECGISIARHSFFWGPASSSLSPHREEILASLTVSNAPLSEIMASINPSWLTKSIEQFPVDLDYDKITSEEDLDKDEKEESVVYDPRFMLSFFASLFALGGQFNVRQWIELNGLGYTCLALSSLSESIRKAAFFVLDEFYGVFDVSRFIFCLCPY
jgi:hypothetical protein